jgi:acyl-CoA thioesterase-1
MQKKGGQMSVKFFFIVLFAFTSLAESSIAKAKLLILGDSLTEGFGVDREAAFPALLEEKLAEAGRKDLQVINGGVSGSTTAGGLSRLDWLLKGNPTHIIVALGANDGLRGLKLEESEKNLEKIIDKCLALKIKVMIAGMKIPPNYGKDYTAKFEAIFPSLARKYKVTLLPFLLDGVAGNPKFNISDGLHPNVAGHKIIAANILNPVLEFTRD